MSYIWFYKNNNEKVPLNEEINKEVNDSYQSHRKNEIHSTNFFKEDEPNIVYHVDFTKNTITIDNNDTVIVNHSPLYKEEISKSTTNSYGKKHKIKKQSSKKRKVKKYRESKRKSNKKKGKKM